MLYMGGSVETIHGKETTPPTILLQYLGFKGLLLIVKLLLGNFIKEEFCFLLYFSLKCTASPCSGRKSKGHIWVT